MSFMILPGGLYLRCLCLEKSSVYTSTSGIDEMVSLSILLRTKTKLQYEPEHKYERALHIPSCHPPESVSPDQEVPAELTLREYKKQRTEMEATDAPRISKSLALYLPLLE